MDDSPETGAPVEKTVGWADELWQRGFTMIPNGVLLDVALGPTAFRVYVLLAHYAREADECWPGQDGLARLAQCGERALRDALRELEGAKLVETKRRGLGKTNLYRLLAPKPPLQSGEIRRSGAARSAATRARQDAVELEAEEGDIPTANAVGATDDEQPIAQRLVAFFVDESRARNSEPPNRVKGQAARLIGELLTEGVEPRRIALGIRHLLDRGLHPAALPSAVHEASLHRQPRPRHGGMTPDEILAWGGLERAPDGGVRPLRDDPARALPGPETGSRACGDRRALPAAADE